MKIETKSWMYDSKTNALKETSEVVSLGKQLFYEPPGKPKILEYVKNGKVQDPDDYPSYGSGSNDPMFPIFDADGPKHYSIKVVDKTVMRRQPCYALEVTPTEKSQQHFVGTVYVNAETLDVVFMDGGMADTMFGVDSMTFQTEFEQRGDLNVMVKSNLRAEADFPSCFPMFCGSRK